ncbi:MAG: YoaK family protein [Rubrivivax sp.]
MPLIRARALTGRNRSARADRQLGVTLAFVAGAINAGGFLAVRQYTSHMTGIVSAMADSVALGAYPLVGAGMAALFSFVFGAACSAAMVNYARRHQMHSEYTLPLLIEALLLLAFGLLGAQFAQTETLFVPLAVLLLCFIMGLQNAVITKLSSAVIRTTHITGIVTDIGIELGKLCYWNGRGPELLPKVRADRARLRILSLLAMSFFGGGVVGAVGFKVLGYISTVPLAIVLIGLVGVPAYDDLSAAWRHHNHKKGSYRDPS